MQAIEIAKKEEDEHEKVTGEVKERFRTKALKWSSKIFHKKDTFSIIASNFVREQIIIMNQFSSYEVLLYSIT